MILLCLLSLLQLAALVAVNVQLRKLLRLIKPDFSKEDSAVLGMTKTVEETMGRLSQQPKKEN